ncbi:MAG: DUF1836 domain-containing protein [Candidatus Onthovivens sp.]|nr:DUF1836 domain-containing protein [Mollicutes bacterium]MDY4857033.1 DUF1836 domain-containing protein [Candidatus Onthovivens sp.]MDY4937260.1 DUF1836 domain-containing protein [Candidatus Onthovivens sp.]
MGKTLDNFEKTIKDLEDFNLPEYKELPDIALYMEQIVGYIKECLEQFSNKDDSIITPFMVNNYVKAKIINPPKDKKYNRDHIGYLIAISMLKSVVSMRDIAVFIDLDRKSDLYTDKQNLYSFFKSIENESLKNVIHKVKTRTEVFKKANNSKKNKKENFSEDLYEQTNLAYIALRLYTESECNKLIADKIMSQLSNEMMPEKVLNENDIIKIDKRKTLLEAKKLADRNKKK